MAESPPTRETQQAHAATPGDVMHERLKYGADLPADPALDPWQSPRALETIRATEFLSGADTYASIAPPIEVLAQAGQGMFHGNDVVKDDVEFVDLISRHD
eukprot:tig00000459_g1091.t1